MIRSEVRLPIPGTAWKRLASPAAIARSRSRALPPERAAIATLGPMPLTVDQLAEEVALLLGGEAVEGERVVAGDQLGVQEGVAPGRRHRLQRLGRRRRAGSRRRRRRSRRGRRGAPSPRPARRRSSGICATASTASRLPGAAAVADRHRERVGSVVGRGRLGQSRAGFRPSSAPGPCRRRRSRRRPS